MLVYTHNYSRNTQGQGTWLLQANYLRKRTLVEDSDFSSYPFGCF